VEVSDESEILVNDVLVISIVLVLDTKLDSDKEVKAGLFFIIKTLEQLAKRGIETLDKELFPLIVIPFKLVVKRGIETLDKELFPLIVIPSTLEVIAANESDVKAALFKTDIKPLSNTGKEALERTGFD